MVCGLELVEEGEEGEETAEVVEQVRLALTLAMMLWSALKDLRRFRIAVIWREERACLQVCPEAWPVVPNKEEFDKVERVPDPLVISPVGGKPLSVMITVLSAVALLPSESVREYEKV